jgi:hypothetical protein
MSLSGDGDVEIRRARPADLPAIVKSARRALAWTGELDDEALFHWKHYENPFGESPIWIALDRDQVIGVRAFLHWKLRQDTTIVSAVRAVDTATLPGTQRRGVFTRLTLGALPELAAEGVQLVFNTPNARSLPGYLKMDWTEVGRLQARVRIARVRSAFSIMTARQPASRSSIETDVGEPAAAALDERHAVDRLLGSLPDRTDLVTAVDSAVLAWRYGHPQLRYRVMRLGTSIEDGFAIFRLRRRGHAIEAAVCDVLTPESDPVATRRLLRRIARSTEASYLLWLARTRRHGLPIAGPLLTCRRLDGQPVPALGDWGFVLGDIELL